MNQVLANLIEANADLEHALEGLRHTISLTDLAP